jgi:hypothetical protein
MHRMIARYMCLQVDQEPLLIMLISRGILSFDVCLVVFGAKDGINLATPMVSCFKGPTLIP